MHFTFDFRYISVQYNTIMHPAHMLCPNGRAMGVFRELFEEKWPRDIGRECRVLCRLYGIAMAGLLNIIAKLLHDISSLTRRKQSETGVKVKNQVFDKS